MTKKPPTTAQGKAAPTYAAQLDTLRYSPCVRCREKGGHCMYYIKGGIIRRCKQCNYTTTYRVFKKKKAAAA